MCYVIAGEGCDSQGQSYAGRWDRARSGQCGVYEVAAHCFLASPTRVRYAE